SVTVDECAQAENNAPMNLRRIGKRVQLRRVEFGLTQEALAKKAKVGLGTLQALEDAPNRKRPRQTSTEKIEDIAKALKWTLNDLINEGIEPSDPRLVGLNDEDFVVARMFHDLSSTRKLRVLAILRTPEKDRVAAIALQLPTIDERVLASFEKMMAVPETHVP